MQSMKVYSPLADKKTFHNFLYALLAARDRIDRLNSIMDNTGSYNKQPWRKTNQCRYHLALSERNMIIEDIKQTLIESGANKQRAARIVTRFLWGGNVATAAKLEATLQKLKACRCNFAG